MITKISITKRMLLLIILMAAYMCFPNNLLAYEDDAGEDPHHGWWKNNQYQGLGIGQSYLGMGVEPEDLNDWLESQHYEKFESLGMSQTTIYWSFSRKFQCGIVFYNGSSGWISNRISSSADQYSDTIYSTRYDLSGFGIIAEYKHRFGNNKWMLHAGGGFAAMGMELTLEETELNDSTTVTRYTSGSGALQLDIGILYYLNHYIGLDIEFGILGMNFEEVELGGVEDETFPEMEFGGGYLGIGLKINI